MATAAMVWNIFTWWHKGARLRGAATPNMIMVGGVIEDNNTYIGMTVYNVGDAPTTITNVVLFGYRNRLRRWLRRTEDKAAIVNHSLAQAIPYTLAGGGRFMSRAIQAPELEEWSRHYCLYMGVCHSMSRRPFLMRVKPIAADRDMAILQSADQGR
jgi:hypothetical protein